MIAAVWKGRVEIYFRKKTRNGPLTDLMLDCLLWVSPTRILGQELQRNLCRLFDLNNPRSALYEKGGHFSTSKAIVEDRSEGLVLALTRCVWDHVSVSPIRLAEKLY